MLILAIVVFVVAAFGGLYLLTYVLKGKNTPKGIVIVHGALGAFGILLLLVYGILYSMPIASLIVFVAAAAGGVYMFVRDISGTPPTKYLAMGHGIVAAVGIVLLLVFAWRHSIV